MKKCIAGCGQDYTKEDLNNMKNLYISIDYGQMNATTYECMGFDYKNKCVRGVDEYYYSGRESGKQKSPSEYAQDFKDFKDKIEKETGLKILYVFIDPSAKGLAEEIKRICYDVIIKDANNDVALGISRVQKMLSFQRLFLSSKQVNLISEMYKYEYDTDLLDKGKEVPIKQNDHCEDALRYLIMGIWKLIKQLLPMIGDDEKDVS